MPMFRKIARRGEKIYFRLINTFIREFYKFYNLRYAHINDNENFFLRKNIFLGSNTAQKE